MAGYVAAKNRALTALRRNGTAIIGQSDDHVKQLADLCKGRGIKTLLAMPDEAPLAETIVRLYAAIIMPKMLQRPAWCCIAWDLM